MMPAAYCSATWLVRLSEPSTITPICVDRRCADRVAEALGDVDRDDGLAAVHEPA